jgi:uncharacterized protein (TIGR03083 family)
VAIDYLAHLRADSARFAEVLAVCDPTAPVPTCVGWTAADLLWHLGEVQHSWGTIVRDRLSDWDQYTPPVRPEGRAGLLAFFEDASRTLVEALASTSDEVRVWTWFEGDQSVGFVRRRQAHEALIHRLDAELTAGTVTGFDAELATDGVLEAVEWMFGGAPSWATAAKDGPLGRLVTIDTGATWLVQVGHWSGVGPESGTVYADEAMLFLVADGEPTFEVRGSARDLDAWVWNRPGFAEVKRSGEMADFEAVIRAGVQ